MKSSNHFRGEVCPKCGVGTLEVYFNDKANTIVLGCDSCDEVTDEQSQDDEEVEG